MGRVRALIVLAKKLSWRDWRAKLGVSLRPGEPAGRGKWGARHGNPRRSGLPCWPQHTLARRETLIVDAAMRVEHDPRWAERALFATVPFIQWGR